ncbi:acetylornithine transaminase [Nesterenkonia sp. E16_7]|uniref:acetylornithine transaminase n=1 Tax=unclassified Nesterenkonia TaxID=2629769 RepID=UPI001A915FBA|nr:MULTISPECIES: acetylornithine transaminase [unclassified Nesterenkonia]MBO0594790.1 acetylornithine transaminase [Nesterenkonia sp. E16_10]MBO0597039.1 acetylornithine transaminase [Nesterenkonia sp. E16_7]
MSDQNTPEAQAPELNNADLTSAGLNSPELTSAALTSAELTGATLTAEPGETLLARYTESLLGVFGTPQRVLVRGSGATVWDADGREYLDLLGGIAVNALGHAHPLITSVVSSQLSTLGHISNFFTSPTQIALAEKLLHLAQAPAGSKAFFTNSGTEANEAAFKLARRHGGEDRPRIIALEHGFHGRTMGALAMTHKPSYREPFEPLPGGVEWVPAGDAEALRAAVDETVAAVIIEPVQGEAGVHGHPAGYLKAAREITRAAGALLIFDEVQTGIGRTGSWFASAPSDSDPADSAPSDSDPSDSGPVLPDAMTLAKGLGGGFPIGAMLTFGEHASTLLNPGQHGTTFGGNPAATAAALATLHVIESTDLLDQVREVSAYAAVRLAELDFVTEVRAHGLLIGFDLEAAEGQALAPAMVAAALEAGFIINATGPATLRLAPPLIITTEQIQQFIDALPEIHRRSTS